MRVCGRFIAGDKVATCFVLGNGTAAGSLFGGGVLFISIMVFPRGSRGRPRKTYGWRLIVDGDK